MTDLYSELNSEWEEVTIVQLPPDSDCPASDYRSKLMEQCQSFKSDHTWPASLRCRFHRTSVGKRAHELSHTGPRGVQKLFHDRDLALPVPPPGGMVSGDDLVAGSILILR